jgi:DSBA-like thioredoxin domain
MQLDFWLDPICPWCWLTSRWVNDVAPHRDVQVRWRPISLLFKNDLPSDSPFFERATHTRNLLRVIESVRAAEGDEPIGNLYTTMGEHIHDRGNSFVEAITVLKESGLDVAHADAFDDEQWDAAIKDGMAEGLALTGSDVGTPILGFTNAKGNKVGFFGPVISRRLPEADALQLWDGLMAVATVDSFWELKRTRTENPDFTPV